MHSKCVTRDKDCELADVLFASHFPFLVPMLHLSPLLDKQNKIK